MCATLTVHTMHTPAQVVILPDMSQHAQQAVTPCPGDVMMTTQSPVVAVLAPLLM